MTDLGNDMVMVACIEQFAAAVVSALGKIVRFCIRYEMLSFMVSIYRHGCCEMSCGGKSGYGSSLSVTSNQMASLMDPLDRWVVLSR